MKAQGLNKLNNLLESVNSRNQELLLQISGQKDVYKSGKSSQQKEDILFKLGEKRFTSSTVKNVSHFQYNVKELPSYLSGDHFPKPQVLQPSALIEGRAKIKTFPVRSHSSKKVVALEPIKPEIDAFLMQSEETMHLQMQMKNLQQQLSLKDQLVIDMGKKNSTLNEDINFLNMSYKELKQATDENNTKFNATRKHLREILLILQHKDKELKRLREKFRTNSKDDLDENKEEEKSNDKKILEYALYMEKQYKMLEDKLRKRSKLLPSDQNQNILIQQDTNSIAQKYDKAKQQIMVMKKEKDSLQYQLNELEKSLQQSIQDNRLFQDQVQNLKDDFNNKIKEMNQQEQLYEEEISLKNQMIDQLKNQMQQQAKSSALNIQQSKELKDLQISQIRFEEQVKSLEKQNEKLDVKNKQSLSQVQSLESEIIIIRQQFKRESDSQMKMMRDETNQETLSLKKQSIDDLKKQQKQFNGEKQDLLRQLQILNNQNHEQQIDHQHQQEKVESLQHSINEHKVQNNVLLNQIQSAVEQTNLNEAKQKTFIQIKDTELQEFMLQLETMTSEILHLQSIIEGIKNNEMSSNPTQMSEIMDLSQNNENIANRLKEQIHESEKTNLFIMNRLKEQMLENENLMLENEKLISENQSLTLKCQTQQQEDTHQSNKNTLELQEIITKQSSQLDQLRLYNKEIVQMLDKENQKVSLLRNQYEELLTDLEEKTALIVHHQQELMEKSASIGSLQHQIQSLQVETSTYHKAYLELEEQITQIQSENLNQDLEYQQELKNYEENFDVAQSKILQLQSEKLQLIQDKDNQSSREGTRIEKIREALKQYRTMLRALKKDLQTQRVDAQSLLQIRLDELVNQLQEEYSHQVQSQNHTNNQMNGLTVELEQAFSVENTHKNPFERLRYAIRWAIGWAEMNQDEVRKQSNVQKQKEAQMEQDQIQLQELEAQLIECRRDGKYLQTCIGELKNNIKDLKLNEQNEAKLRQTSQDKINELEAQIGTIKNDLEGKEHDCQQLNRKITQRQLVQVDLELQLKTHQDTIKQLEQQHTQEIKSLTQVKDNQAQELVELKNRNSNLESTMKDLQMQNKMMINDSDKSIKEKYSQMDDMQKQLLCEKTVVDQLTEKLEQKQQELILKDVTELLQSIYQIQLRELTSLSDKSKKQVILSQQNLKDLQDQVLKQTEIISDKDNNITKQIDQITKLHKQINQLQEESNATQQECFQSIQKLKHDYSEIETQLEQSRNDHLDELTKLNSASRKQDDLVIKLKQMNESLELQLQEVTQLSEQLKLQIKKTTRDQEIEIKALQDDKFRAEKESIILLNTVQEQNTKQQGQLIAQIKKLQQDIKNLQNENESLIEQHTQKETMTGDQQLKLMKGLEQQILQLQTQKTNELHEMQEENKKSTQNQEQQSKKLYDGMMNKLTSEIQQLHQDVTKSNQEREDMSQKMKQSIKSKQEEIVAIQKVKEDGDKNNESQIQEIRSFLREKDQKLQEANERQRALNNELQKQETLLRESHQSNKYLELDLVGLRRDIEQLQVEKQSLKQIISVLHEEVLSLQQKIELNMTQIKDLTNVNKNLSDSISTLERSLLHKDELLNGITQNHGGVERDKLELQIQLDNLITSKAQLTDQLAQSMEKLRSDTESSDQQINTLKQHQVQLTQDHKLQITQLNDQISQLKDQLDASQKREQNQTIEIIELKQLQKETNIKQLTAQEEIFSYNNKIIGLETQLEERSMVINNLTNDNKNLELSIEQLQRQVTTTQKEKEEQIFDLQTQTQELTKKHAQHTTQCQSTIKSLQEQSESQLNALETQSSLKNEEIVSTKQLVTQKLQEIDQLKKLIALNTDSAQDSIKNLIEKNDTNQEQLEVMRLQLQDMNQHNLNLKQQVIELKGQQEQQRTFSQNLSKVNDDKPFGNSDVSSIDKEEMIGFMGNSFDSQNEEPVIADQQSQSIQNGLQQQSLNNQIPLETRSLNEHTLQKTIKLLQDENDTLKKQNQQSFYSHQQVQPALSERQDSIIQDLKNEAEFLKYKVNQMEEVQSDMQQQEQKYVTMVRQLKQEKHRVETEMSQSDFSHQKRQIKQLLNSFIQSLSTNAKETEEYLGIVLNIVEFTEKEKEALQTIVRDVIKDRKKGGSSKGGFFNNFK